MKPSSNLIASFALLSLTACGGGDTHESLTDESLDLMEEMVVVIEGIEDEASAEAAKPRLEALAEKGKDLQQRMEALGKPDAETEKAVEARLGDRMKEVQKRLMNAMMALMDKPEIQQMVQESMSAIGGR